MSKHVVSFIVHVRGADDRFSEAYRKAVGRLNEVAEAVSNGKQVVDPGADFRVLDPGGGGGPCVPNLRTQDFDVSDSGLPEAVSRDDDD